MLSAKRALREESSRRDAAEAELRALLDARAAAYAAFDRSADSALTESAILEIASLNARCGCLLRALKSQDAPQKGGTNLASDPDHPRRRRSAAEPAAPHIEKTD